MPGDDIDFTEPTPPADWDPFKDGPFQGQDSTNPGAVSASMVGPSPLMDTPSDGRVLLDRGISIEGEWHREAFMRETTGADEEALARFDLSKPGAQFLYWDLLLGRTVVQIGSVNFEEMSLNARQSKLRQLLIGDREALFFGITRATWGDIRKIEGVGCPNCGEVSDQNIVLGDKVKVGEEVLDCDFTFKKMDDPEQMWYEVPIRHDRVVELRLPTGDDILAIAVATKAETSASARNTIMLDRVISKCDGVPVKPGFGKNLSTPDRASLVNYMMEEQPGPRLGGVTTSCASCTREFWLDLGLARLLQLAI